MGILDRVFGFRRGSNSSAFAGSSVMVLTLLIIMSGCFGGGGGGSGSGSGLAATSGTLCMSGDYSYRVELSGSSAYDRTVEVNPFESAYGGSIGGQIRGLASLSVTISDSDISEILFWGSGASIKYGTSEETLGKIALSKPGAVNDIAPVSLNSKQMLIYGTEKGLGIAGPNSAGTAFVDYASQGAWRSVPDGVTSLDVSDDGSSVVFTTGDGFIQQMKPADLLAGESCSGIVASEIVGAESGSTFVPVRTQVGTKDIFVLSKASAYADSSSPTFEQAYNPIFLAMISDGVYSRVRAYPSGGGSAVEPGFATSDTSFERFDRFLPTDVAWDGQSLYVVGVAYAQSSVSDFLTQKCATSTDQSQQIQCMAAAAKDGTLASFEGGTGIYRFIAGFFVYRNMDDLSKADHFKEIQLTALRHQEEAPPYIYAIGVQSDRAFVRGPNFLASIGRTEGDDGEEDWNIDSVADLDQDLVAGLPNRVVPYMSGAAASFTAIKAADGSGASAVELMDSSGNFSELDTGAIYVRPDGAGQSTALIAAIEMESSRGGKLFLENAASRYAIDPNIANSYVSNASYNGSTLAFAASQTGTSSQYEYNYGWHVMVQSGNKSSTRGDLFLARAGGPNGEFSGYPEVTSSDTYPNTKRRIGGIGLASSAVAVMFTGYSGGKWYHQVFLYGLSKSDDDFNAPSFLGKSGLITTTAASSAHVGDILNIKKSGSSYEVVFSTPKNIYKWTGPSGSTTSLYNSDTLVDASIDATDSDKIAIVSGFKVYVKSLSSMSSAGAVVQITAKEGTSMTYLYDAEVALSGDVLAVVTPYAANATFSVFQLSGTTLTPVAQTSLAGFLDVKLFSSFPTYLLASSPSSGIEIYSIAGD